MIFPWLDTGAWKQCSVRHYSDSPVPRYGAQMQQYCRTCPECQLTQPKGHLQAMPPVSTPLESMGIDIVARLLNLVCVETPIS